MEDVSVHELPVPGDAVAVVPEREEVEVAEAQEAAARGTL